MHRVHVATDRVAPSGAAIFLGDSIPQRLPASLIAPDAINYGIGSQTTRDLARHVADYAAAQDARIIYLMIGLNDLGAGEAPDFEAVLSALPTDVPLVWTGVTPAENVQGIDAANEAVASLCIQRGTCTYVPPPASWDDLDTDGRHLKPSGYAKWVAALRGL